MAKTRTCVVCRNKYDYCPICSRDKDKPTWMFAFCSPECKDLDNILAGHTSGRISTEDAKKQLTSLNYDINNLNDKENKEHINEIMGSNTKAVNDDKDSKKLFGKNDK